MLRAVGCAGLGRVVLCVSYHWSLLWPSSQRAILLMPVSQATLGPLWVPAHILAVPYRMGTAWYRTALRVPVVCHWRATSRHFTCRRARAPLQDVFRLALRAAKYWAALRGISSNVMGYLGGVNLAIITAKVRQRLGRSHGLRPQPCHLYPRRPGPPPPPTHAHTHDTCRPASRGALRSRQAAPSPTPPPLSPPTHRHDAGQPAPTTSLLAL